MGKKRFLELSSKSEFEEKVANKTSKKAAQGDDRKDAGGQEAVWLHLQPWPGRRGENPLTAGYLG